MDQYAPYVIAAYAATALILAGLVLQSLAASRRARRDLEDLNRERDK